MIELQIDDYTANVQRICKECKQAYSIKAFLDSSRNYFGRPFGYRKGCERYCLACWLGVGPYSIGDDADESLASESKRAADDGQIPTHKIPQIHSDLQGWLSEEVYEAIL